MRLSAVALVLWGALGCAWASGVFPSAIEATYDPDAPEDKLNEVNLLLPPYGGVRFLLYFSKGCFEWRSRNSSVVSVRALRARSGAVEPECPLGYGRVAEVGVVGRAGEGDRVVGTLVEAHRLSGGARRVGVTVAPIEGLEILTTTRVIARGRRERVGLIGTDGKGNTFSTLEGLKFEWTAANLPEERASGERVEMVKGMGDGKWGVGEVGGGGVGGVEVEEGEGGVLEVRGLKSYARVSAERLRVEEQGLYLSDSVMLEGRVPGRSELEARLAQEGEEEGRRHVSTGKMEFRVADESWLEPQGPLLVPPATEVQFELMIAFDSSSSSSSADLVSFANGTSSHTRLSLLWVAAAGDAIEAARARELGAELDPGVTKVQLPSPFHWLASSHEPAVSLQRNCLTTPPPPPPPPPSTSTSPSSLFSASPLLATLAPSIPAAAPRLCAAVGVGVTWDRDERAHGEVVALDRRLVNFERSPRVHVGVARPEVLVMAMEPANGALGRARRRARVKVGRWMAAWAHATGGNTVDAGIAARMLARLQMLRAGTNGPSWGRLVEQRGPLDANRPFALTQGIPMALRPKLLGHDAAGVRSEMFIGHNVKFTLSSSNLAHAGFIKDQDVAKRALWGQDIDTQALCANPHAHLTDKVTASVAVLLPCAVPATTLTLSAAIQHINSSTTALTTDSQETLSYTLPAKLSVTEHAVVSAPVTLSKTPKPTTTSAPPLPPSSPPPPHPNLLLLPLTTRASFAADAATLVAEGGSGSYVFRARKPRAIYAPSLAAASTPYPQALLDAQVAPPDTQSIALTPPSRDEEEDEDTGGWEWGEENVYSSATTSTQSSASASSVGMSGFVTRLQLPEEATSILASSPSTSSPSSLPTYLPTPSTVMLPFGALPDPGDVVAVRAGGGVREGVVEAKGVEGIAAVEVFDAADPGNSAGYVVAVAKPAALFLLPGAEIEVATGSQIMVGVTAADAANRHFDACTSLGHSLLWTITSQEDDNEEQKSASSHASHFHSHSSSPSTNGSAIASLSLPSTSTSSSSSESMPSPFPLHSPCSLRSLSATRAGVAIIHVTLPPPPSELHSGTFPTLHTSARVLVFPSLRILFPPQWASASPNPTKRVASPHRSSSLTVAVDAQQGATWIVLHGGPSACSSTTASPPSTSSSVSLSISRSSPATSSGRGATLSTPISHSSLPSIPPAGEAGRVLALAESSDVAHATGASAVRRGPFHVLRATCTGVDDATFSITAHRVCDTDKEIESENWDSDTPRSAPDGSTVELRVRCVARDWNPSGLIAADMTAADEQVSNGTAASISDPPLVIPRGRSIAFLLHAHGDHPSSESSSDLGTLPPLRLANASDSRTVGLSDASFWVQRKEGDERDDGLDGVSVRELAQFRPNAPSHHQQLQSESVLVLTQSAMTSISSSPPTPLTDQVLAITILASLFSPRSPSLPTPILPFPMEDLRASRFAYPPSATSGLLRRAQLAGAASAVLDIGQDAEEGEYVVSGQWEGGGEATGRVIRVVPGAEIEPPSALIYLSSLSTTRVSCSGGSGDVRLSLRRSSSSSSSPSSASTSSDSNPSSQTTPSSSTHASSPASSSSSQSSSPSSSSSRDAVRGVSAWDLSMRRQKIGAFSDWPAALVSSAWHSERAAVVPLQEGSFWVECEDEGAEAGVVGRQAHLHQRSAAFRVARAADVEISAKSRYVVAGTLLPLEITVRDNRGNVFPQSQLAAMDIRFEADPPLRIQADAAFANATSSDPAARVLPLLPPDASADADATSAGVLPQRLMFFARGIEQGEARVTISLCESRPDYDTHDSRSQPSPSSQSSFSSSSSISSSSPSSSSSCRRISSNVLDLIVLAPPSVSPRAIGLLPLASTELALAGGEIRIPTSSSTSTSPSHHAKTPSTKRASKSSRSSSTASSTSSSLRADFLSRDASIAAVDQTGLVVARGEGRTTVRVRLVDRSAAAGNVEGRSEEELEALAVVVWEVEVEIVVGVPSGLGLQLSVPTSGLVEGADAQVVMRSTDGTTPLSTHGVPRLVDWSVAGSGEVVLVPRVSGTPLEVEQSLRRRVAIVAALESGADDARAAVEAVLAGESKDVDHGVVRAIRSALKGRPTTSTAQQLSEATAELSAAASAAGNNAGGAVVARMRAVQNGDVRVNARARFFLGRSSGAVDLRGKLNVPVSPRLRLLRPTAVDGACLGQIERELGSAVTAASALQIKECRHASAHSELMTHTPAAARRAVEHGACGGRILAAPGAKITLETTSGQRVVWHHAPAPHALSAIDGDNTPIGSDGRLLTAATAGRVSVLRAHDPMTGQWLSLTLETREPAGLQLRGPTSLALESRVELDIVVVDALGEELVVGNGSFLADARAPWDAREAANCARSASEGASDAIACHGWTSLSDAIAQRVEAERESEEGEGGGDDDEAGEVGHGRAIGASSSAVSSPPLQRLATASLVSLGVYSSDSGVVSVGLGGQGERDKPTLQLTAKTAGQAVVRAWVPLRSLAHRWLGEGRGSGKWGERGLWMGEAMDEDEMWFGIERSVLTDYVTVTVGSPIQPRGPVTVVSGGLVRFAVSPALTKAAGRCEALGVSPWTTTPQGRVVVESNGYATAVKSGVTIVKFDAQSAIASSSPDLFASSSSSSSSTSSSSSSTTSSSNAATTKSSMSSESIQGNAAEFLGSGSDAVVAEASVAVVELGAVHGEWDERSHRVFTDARLRTDGAAPRFLLWLQLRSEGSLLPLHLPSSALPTLPTDTSTSTTSSISSTSSSSAPLSSAFVDSRALNHLEVMAPRAFEEFRSQVRSAPPLVRTPHSRSLTHLLLPSRGSASSASNSFSTSTTSSTSSSSSPSFTSPMDKGNGDDSVFQRVVFACAIDPHAGGNVATATAVGPGALTRPSEITPAVMHEAGIPASTSTSTSTTTSTTSSTSSSSPTTSSPYSWVDGVRVIFGSAPACLVVPRSAPRPADGASFFRRSISLPPSPPSSLHVHLVAAPYTPETAALLAAVLQDEVEEEGNEASASFAAMQAWDRLQTLAKLPGAVHSTLRRPFASAVIVAAQGGLGSLATENRTTIRLTPDRPTAPLVLYGSIEDLEVTSSAPGLIDAVVHDLTDSDAEGGNGNGQRDDVDRDSGLPEASPSGRLILSASQAAIQAGSADAIITIVAPATGQVEKIPVALRQGNAFADSFATAIDAVVAGDTDLYPGERDHEHTTSQGNQAQQSSSFFSGSFLSTLALVVLSPVVLYFIGPYLSPQSSDDASTF